MQLYFACTLVHFNLGKDKGGGFEARVTLIMPVQTENKKQEPDI